MMEILKKTNINFVGKRYYAFLFSGILVTLGIIAFIFIFMGRANLGIDFAGGTMIQGSFEKPMRIGQIRDALSRNGYGDADITELKAREVPYFFMIRLKSTAETGSKVANEVMDVLKKEFPDNNFRKDSVDEVGPAVGKILQQQARLAVLIALAGILVYIWIRFDFRFGVAATIATFHDVLAVLGIMFILHKEITLLIVTALLTLAGYSLTDTVVVYDRIRENLKLFRKKGDFAGTINASINEVLSRTIITGGGTLLAVLSVFIFAGEVVHDFALALILGILVGTYSSWFVAAPIVLEWEKWSPKRFK
ncbi:MAG: protein translocase subunit SecF [candidate division Zixibacteria bacterium]|nr:protein translocase subunit SecF [candidate division Zixibacteria bacterium]